MAWLASGRSRRIVSSSRRPIRSARTVPRATSEALRGSPSSTAISPTYSPRLRLAITNRVERLDRVGTLDTVAAAQPGECGRVRIVRRESGERPERDRSVVPCGAHECVTRERGAFFFTAQSASNGVIAHRKSRASARDLSRAVGDGRRGHPSQSVERVVDGGPVLDRTDRDLERRRTELHERIGGGDTHRPILVADGGGQEGECRGAGRRKRANGGRAYPPVGVGRETHDRV